MVRRPPWLTTQCISLKKGPARRCRCDSATPTILVCEGSGKIKDVVDRAGEEVPGEDLGRVATDDTGVPDSRPLRRSSRKMLSGSGRISPPASAFAWATTHSQSRSRSLASQGARPHGAEAPPSSSSIARFGLKILRHRSPPSRGISLPNFFSMSPRVKSPRPTHMPNRNACSRDRTSPPARSSPLHGVSLVPELRSHPGSYVGCEDECPAIGAPQVWSKGVPGLCAPTQDLLGLQESLQPCHLPLQHPELELMPPHVLRQGAPFRGACEVNLWSHSSRSTCRFHLAMSRHGNRPSAEQSRRQPPVEVQPHQGLFGPRTYREACAVGLPVTAVSTMTGETTNEKN